jgi:hypothetical protein
LRLALDAFDDDVEAQRAQQLENRDEHLGGRRVLGHTLEECVVELDPACRTSRRRFNDE